MLLDDGSTDGSLQIAREAAHRDPRFRVYPRNAEGLINTLNAGIDLVRGEFIARMDADDWMHRDRLLAQQSILKMNSDLIATGCYVRIFPRQSMRDGRRRYEEWLHSLKDPETLWRNRFIECPVAHPTLMIRNEALQELRYQDHGWPEDYDLMLRILRGGPRIGMVHRRLLGWRDRPERLSRVDPRYSLDEFTRCRAWHLSHDFLRGHTQFSLWGHGRTGRALRKSLEALGHTCSTIIDVHPRRVGQSIRGARVLSPDALPTQSRDPMIVSVAGASPRSEIRSALAGKGYREGVNFVCAA